MEGRYGSDDDEVELSLQEQWNMLIEKDLDLIWKIRIYVNESWFQPYIDKVVSSNPFADISMLTWFSFIIAVTEFGFPFLWICTGNLFFAQVLRWTLGCRRPFEFDGRLRKAVKTDKYIWSYGFPSLETHMAVVVYGGIAFYSGKWQLLWLFTPIIAFVGFTRVYACARFIHQVALSGGTGALGLALAFWAVRSLRAWGVRYRCHYYWAFLALTVVLVVVGLWAESNECSWLGVPREEYRRVLRGILETSPLGPPGGGADGGGGDGGGGGGRRPPTAAERRRRRGARRDSFHHLQRTIEARALETRRAKRAQELESLLATPVYGEAEDEHRRRRPGGGGGGGGWAAGEEDRKRGEEAEGVVGGGGGGAFRRTGGGRRRGAAGWGPG